MNRIALLVLSLPVLATVTAAQTTFYLHKSGSPVPVPGGTTTFVLDQPPPVAPIPVVESASLSKGKTTTFPTFIAPTFGGPVTLGIGFDVIVHLSANQSMTDCAVVSALVERVDPAGVRSPVAQRSVFASVPQGGGNGTTGFAPVLVHFPDPSDCEGPFDDTTFAAGESVAVTVSVSNKCKANRTVFLAYDAAAAPGSATFISLVGRISCAQFKCETSVSKAGQKFIGSKAKCVLKCEASARKGVVPFSECDPPYAGDTLFCIGDVVKGAQTKFAAAILKGCTKTPLDCPVCYSGADCSLTGQAVASVVQFESIFDAFVPAIACEDTTDKGKAKCQDGVSKTLTKYSASATKCYDKCFANFQKGRIVAGACAPPAPDPATATCLTKAADKSSAGIDKACFLPPAVAPTCYDNAVHPPAAFQSPNSGAAWTALAALSVDVTIPTVYCGSPSGAFL